MLETCMAYPLKYSLYYLFSKVNIIRVLLNLCVVDVDVSPLNSMYIFMQFWSIMVVYCMINIFVLSQSFSGSN